MRKFIFSAIAIVALSNVSFAETTNNDSKKSLDGKIKIIKDIFLKQGVKSTDNCGGVWSATRIYALNQGFTSSQADCIAMSAYLSCVGVPDNAVRDTGIIC